MSDTTETLQQHADRLVRQEVHCCLSSLVSTLASASGMFEERTRNYSGGREDVQRERAVIRLQEQAFELATPLPDYEEAAREAGAIQDRTTGNWLDKEGTGYADAQHFCDDNGIEPHEREVYEFWATSSWLADKLEATGEKVDRDFAGLTVWARTTTGQAISIDHVIETIAAELIDANREGAR